MIGDLVVFLVIVAVAAGGGIALGMLAAPRIAGLAGPADADHDRDVADDAGDQIAANEPNDPIERPTDRGSP